MKQILALTILLTLAACASPTMKMSDQQIVSLSDDQLCSYKNNYREEPRLNMEIEARGLNCNRFYRECLKRGNTPNTEAFAFCVDTVRENERLRDQWDRYDNRRFLYGLDDYDRLRSVR